MGLINRILGTLLFPVALLLICIIRKNLAYFKLGKIRANATETSTLFYVYVLKYCSSGDNQMRFSAFIAVNSCRVQNRRSLLAKCECERLRSSTQVSTLPRNIEYQKAKRHRGCLHYDLFIAQL